MKFWVQIVAVGIAVVVILFLGLLIRNLIKKWRNDKCRAVAYISLGIFAFLVFPLTLNAVITNRWYVKIPIQSELEPKDWFAFWGSYISSMVAILLGWVAYQQAELSNKQQVQTQKQQEQLTQLTKIVSIYQLKPRIAIKSFCIRAFNQPLKEYQTCWYIEDLYFTYFGQKRVVEGKRFIVLDCDIIHESMIPASKYDICWINWEIADMKFQINLDGYHDKPITDKMVIIIDENTKCSEGINDLFEAVTMHMKYNNYKKVNFDKSILTLGVLFYNNIKEQDSGEVGSSFCEIKCMINSAKITEGSNEVQAVPYIEWGE